MRTENTKVKNNQDTLTEQQAGSTALRDIKNNVSATVTVPGARAQKRDKKFRNRGINIIIYRVGPK